jgi:hypothetical protein
MEIYYQYEADNKGIIVTIHSSHQPFGEREIPKEIINKVRCGKTTVEELIAKRDALRAEFEDLEKESEL